MLFLLFLAAAEICWQLEVDMEMAALLEVRCVCLLVVCFNQPYESHVSTKGR